MKDEFLKRLHGCVGCTGGLHCPYDRPHPGSSRGARRLRQTKNRTRRCVRRSMKRVDVD